MLKIEIFPLIEESKYTFFINKINNGDLYGTIDDIFNGKYIKLNDVTHFIKEIIIVENKMWALIEFTNNKLGSHIEKITNLNLDKIQLKYFFIDENNFGLNLKSKSKLRGVTS